jgi:hypothetical protein
MSVMEWRGVCVVNGKQLTTTDLAEMRSLIQCLYLVSVPNFYLRQWKAKSHDCMHIRST